MKLLDFYKKVIESVGLTYDDDGYIKAILSNNESSLVMVDGKPLVLPLRNQIESMYSIEEGKTVIIKSIFNPLKEDIVSGENSSLHKLRNMISRLLSHRIASVGNYLLAIAIDKDLQTKAPIDINLFIGTLNEARQHNVKAVVDDETVNKFTHLFGKTLEELPISKGFVSMFPRKGGVIGGNKFNRVTTAKFNIYHELKSMTKDDRELHGVKLRNKDKIVFEKLFKFILGDDIDKLAIGSNDKQSPGFISVFTIYNILSQRINEMVDSLAFMDDPDLDKLKIEFKLTNDEISNVAIYEKELKLIPDTNANTRKQSRIAMDIANERKASNPRSTDIKNIVNRHNQNQPPLRQEREVVQQHDEVETLSPAEKILRKRYSEIRNSSYQNHPQRGGFGINEIMKKSRQPRVVERPINGISNRGRTPRVVERSLDDLPW